MLMVIGCGFVGGTIADSLEELGNEVVRIDPRLNNNKIRDYKHAEGAIICLPTPTIDGKPSALAVIISATLTCPSLLISNG